jgi:mRNA interferase MazF
MVKDFQAWQSKKLQIHERNTQNIFFHQKEVWWCSVGCNIGTEIDGKHSDFERPVLIMKKINRQQFIGLPLTTKYSSSRKESFPRLAGKKITGTILFNQVKVLSSKRLLRKVEKITTVQSNSILEDFTSYLKDRPAIKDCQPRSSIFEPK